ncbi:MAG: hypothetical protein JWO85_537 [Candidatus Eremiobacteraeota bacterium]|nr:hypothetical protein [Candidatus Eremiobacteraeota bacterium]
MFERVLEPRAAPIFAQTIRALPAAPVPAALFQPRTGHRLSTLIDGAALREPAAGPVVQRVLGWDKRQKAAAGAASVGGLGLLGSIAGFAGGLLTASAATIAAPVVAAGALAAGAGYLYYRHQNHPMTRLETLRAGVPAAADPTLHHVLNESIALGHGPHTNVRESGSPNPNGATTGPRAGSYAVELDDTIADPDERASYLTHELTHVAADRTYPENARFPGSFMNVPDAAPATPLTGATINADIAVLQGLIAPARVAILADAAIPLALRTHVINRLDTYMVPQPHIEFDTVANELLVYLRLKGQQATATYAQISALSAFGNARRV